MAPWRGLVYLKDRPKLWPWVAAPVLVYLLVVIPTAWWMWGRLPAWIAGIAPPPDVELLAGIWWLAVRVLSLVLFVGVAAVQWVIVSAVTRPAYGVVTEIVEAEIEGEPARFDVMEIMVDAAWSAWHSVLSLGLYLGVSLVVSGVAFVPGVGEILAPLLAMLASVVWLARELVDGPLSRRKLGFGAKLGFLRKHWPEVIGLGAATAVALIIPVVDLVVLPAAFVGATLWYAETHRSRGP